MEELDGRLDTPKTATIMMVDDEPTTIDVLEAFLEGQGFTNFVTTTDSRQALELLSSEGADVLLLDLNMPHVDGFEILQAVRDHETLAHTPVIVLTSSTDSSTKLRALELGATDFLSKPVDPSELALRLRNTLAAKAHQDRLTYYDTVTGLPNRRSFIERTDRALARARCESARCALFHVDLNRFEQINDTLGHRVGDELLRAVSLRLEESVRSGDLVGSSNEDGRESLSRIGGDEFAIFFPAVRSAEHAAKIARRLIARVSEEFLLAGHELFVTCNVGITLFPGDGEDVDLLLRRARMCNSKQSGQEGYCFYRRALNEESFERLSLEQELRRALDREQMLLLYQPKVDVSTGSVVGAEALMRWHHPELGLVSPERFIPLAEEAGLIGSLGTWALRVACRQAMEWQRAGLPPFRLSVNVSTQQFLNGDLVETIWKAVRDSGLDARYLVLEITEGMIMENPRDAAAMLDQMKVLNLGLSVDDFGTGYSALSYLKRFPLDEVKIDRSFMSGIPQDADDVAIVSAIIVMAHTLGLRVVAEGVETQEQLALLREQGCDEFQGFLYSEPVPATEFARLLGKS